MHAIIFEKAKYFFKNLNFKTNMMFYSTQKEVKSYNMGRTFLPLFSRFYKGFIKTVRQSAIIYGLSKVPSPSILYTEASRYKTGRAPNPKYVSFGYR